MTTIDTARAILGPHFLGTEEVEQQFRVRYTPEELQQLNEIPFSEETLRACKDTHVLVAGYPLSIVDLYENHPTLFYSGAIRWLEGKAFVTGQKVRLCWYLLRKEPVPESYGKTYPQQTALLSEEEEVPLACEVTYAVILSWLVHDERLLQTVYARCQDLSSDGGRIYVGNFGSYGFDADYDGDGHCRICLGLASSRKPELAS